MLARSARMTVAAVVMVCGLAASAAWGDEVPRKLSSSRLPELVSARTQDAPRPAMKQDGGGPIAAKGVEGLPIKKITLYRSGVGYFERSGQVSDNAEIQLRFNTEQINDILKSMVLLDLNGGKIDSVSYGSKEPLAKRLASFGINIASNPSVPDLLNQLRGAVLKVGVAGAEITGTVLGVETRQVAGGDKGQPPLNVPFVNLVTSAGVRSLAIPELTSFEIQDKELAGELNKALAALAEYRADRTKTVDLRFAGQGSRRVVVGYVHEMPVWKTSYRLILPELDAAGNTKGEIAMQGWAIVENTTDQDWNGVQLGLVSGRPVSFQMDLYEPLFSARPWVSVPTIPGVAPRVFGLGVDADQLEAAGAAGRTVEGMMANRMQTESMKRMSRGAPGSPAPAPMVWAAKPGDASGGEGKAYFGVTAGDMLDYTAKAAAQAASVGEVFQFQVESPVSIERQRSAMIPILTTKVSGRRVSIFNAADGSVYPMRGVEITNDSGLALLPGPISVLDGAAYAGDAQIGQIPKNDKRLLAYALDLDMAVLTKPETHQNLMKVTIVDGLIRQTYKDRLVTAYEFANKDTQRGRTVVLEHPKNHEFELVETDKPSELTPDLYRFTMAVEAGKAKKFTVTQERTRWESVGVTGYDLNTLLGYKRDGKVSDKVIEAVRTAASKQSAINATERQIAELGTKMEEISKDQARIRQNMQAIDRTSELYKTYVKKLTDQETKVEEMRDQQGKAQVQLEGQRRDLEEYLRNLTVE